MSMASERKAEMKVFHSDDVIVSDRIYNLTLGATVLWGVAMNIILCIFCGDFVSRVNPYIFIIAYITLALGGQAISYKSKNPVISFIGYNMVVVPVGLVVASLVSYYGGVGAEEVELAFLFTAIITGCMISLSIIYPGFFSRIGGLLFSGLIGLVLSGIVMTIFGIDSYIYSWIGAIIFSLYIGYDYYVAQRYIKTVDNAVDSAISLYLDITNLFLDLLRILGRKK